jgi:hypothetical protein
VRSILNEHDLGLIFKVGYALACKNYLDFSRFTCLHTVCTAGLQPDTPTAPLPMRYASMGYTSMGFTSMGYIAIELLNV